jgi:NAD(P)H dehydrogenase (quinone)
VILVTGASGYVGRTAFRRLVSAGADVAALVRNPERGREHLPQGVAIRIADYEDPSSLEDAFEGVTRLLFIASDGDARDVMRHHANVLSAATTTRVEHIVFTSITDIEETSPFYFTPVYRDAERRLADLGTGYTILRCGLYADFVLSQWIEPAVSTGVTSLPVGEARVAPVSRDDVAEVAAILVATDHHGMTYELTGPAAHSFDEIVAFASRVVDAPIRYVPCAPSDYMLRAWRELEDPWPHAFSTLCASIAQDRYARVSPDGANLLGRQPERMEAFLGRTLIPTTEGEGHGRNA